MVPYYHGFEYIFLLFKRVISPLHYSVWPTAYDYSERRNLMQQYTAWRRTALMYTYYRRLGSKEKESSTNISRLMGIIVSFMEMKRKRAHEGEEVLRYYSPRELALRGERLEPKNPYSVVKYVVAQDGSPLSYQHHFTTQSRLCLPITPIDPRMTTIFYVSTKTMEDSLVQSDHNLQRL